MILPSKLQKEPEKIAENKTFSSSVNKHSNAKTNSNTLSQTKNIPVAQPTSSQEDVKTLQSQKTDQIRITSSDYNIST